MKLTFQTSVRSERVLDAARAQQEANLLEPSVPPGQWHLNGDRHHSSLQASVERTHEIDGVVVWVHQGHAVPGLDGVVPSYRAAAASLRREGLVEESVSDFQ